MAAAVRALPSEPWSTSISASAAAGRRSGSSKGAGMEAWAAQGSGPDGASSDNPHEGEDRQATQGQRESRARAFQSGLGGSHSPRSAHYPGSSSGQAHASAGPLRVKAAGHPPRDLAPCPMQPHGTATWDGPMPCSSPSSSSLSEGEAAPTEPGKNTAEGCGPEAEVQPSTRAASAVGSCLGPRAMGRAARPLGRKAVSLRSRDLEAVASPAAPETMPSSPSFPPRALSEAGPGASLEEGGQAPGPLNLTPRKIKKSAGARLRDLEASSPAAHVRTLHRASSLVASLLGVDADPEEGASLTPRAGAGGRRLSKKSASMRTRELEAEPVLSLRSPRGGGVSLGPASPGQGNPAKQGASKGRTTGLKESPSEGSARRLSRRLSKTGMHLSGRELEAEPLSIRSPRIGHIMQGSPSLAATLTKLEAEPHAEPHAEPEEFAGKPTSPGTGKTGKKVSKNSLSAKSRDVEATPVVHPRPMKPLGRSSSLAVTFNLEAETAAPRRKPAGLTSGLGEPVTEDPELPSPDSKRFEAELSLEVPSVLLGEAMILSPLGVSAKKAPPAMILLESAALLPPLLPTGEALEECMPGNVTHELLQVYRGRYEQAEARAIALETKLKEKAAATKLVFEEAKAMRRALERELVEAKQDLKVYKLKHERMEFSVKFLEGKLKTQDKMAAEALEQVLQQNAGLKADLVELRRSKDAEKTKEKEGPAVSQLLHAMRAEHASMREYQRSLEDEIRTLKDQLEGVVKANEGMKSQAI